MVLKYVETLKKDDNAAATRGFALALGALPKKLLQGHIDLVIKTLAEATDPNRYVHVSVWLCKPFEKARWFSKERLY